jgi:phosphoenolpyruvate carboxylase
VLADGRLADLIRRVATFGMVLMKLDVRQVQTIITTVAYAYPVSVFLIYIG